MALVTDEIPFVSEYRSLHSLVRPLPIYIRFLVGKNSLVTRWWLTDDTFHTALTEELIYEARYRRWLIFLPAIV